MSENEKRKPSVWLYLAALSSLMGALSSGAIVGWSSPALVDMAQNGSTPQLTEETGVYKTWIGSVMTLGALFGGLIIGPIIGVLGLRKTLILLGAPFALCWALIFFSKQFWTIILGRACGGVATGLCSGVAPTYCVQIATPSIRGQFGAAYMLLTTIGILYIQVFGLFLGWKALCIVGVLPAIALSISMFFMPESPEFIASQSGSRKENQKELLAAETKLRAPDSDVKKEVKEITERTEKSQKDESEFSFRQLKRPDVYKPFIIGMALMFFQQFCGIYAVLMYSSSIFADTGSEMDPKISVCIISAVMVVTTLVSAFIIDKLGRKKLLLVSGAGHCLSLAVLGFYYWQKRNTATATDLSVFAADLSAMAVDISEKPSRSELWWLPLICLVIFIISYSIGFGPITSMIVAEISPKFALGYITSSCTAFNYFCAFIVTKTFDDLQKLLKPQGAFWFFAFWSAVSVVYVVVFVPETKGKSIEDMQKIFNSNKSETKEKDNNK